MTLKNNLVILNFNSKIIFKPTQLEVMDNLGKHYQNTEYVTNVDFAFKVFPIKQPTA